MRPGIDRSHTGVGEMWAFLRCGPVAVPARLCAWSP